MTTPPPPPAEPGPGLHLTLVRHGATAWNENGRWQGLTDNPLGPLGEQQARDLGQSLLAGQQHFDLVYSSDLQRAARTAQIALGELGELAQERYSRLDVRLDPRLREYNFGDYEGLTIPEMQRQPGFAEWQQDPWQHAVSGGESLSELAQRLLSWLDEVSATLPEGGHVVAFSHSIAIRTLLVALFQLPLVPQENYPIPYSQRIGNGQAVYIWRHNGVWQRA